jgi:mono/diheme cytochrome c family protein
MLSMSATRALFVVSLAALAVAPDVRAQTGQQLYTTWCQGCHSFPGNNHNGVLKGKDWHVISNAIQTKLEMRIELGPAYRAGIITDDDLMAIAGYLQTFAGGVAPPTPSEVSVVEYFNAAFGHYFMTADADEIAGLDAGAFNFAFVRTGRTFNAYSSQAAGTVPVCRFFTTPGTFGAKSSHFYTADPVECDGLKLNPNWVYEKIAFFIAVPSGGLCPVGTTPIYRMYNNGQTGAPNHRFSSDFPTYQDFTTNKNWAPEGTGFCSP